MPPRTRRRRGPELAGGTRTASFPGKTGPRRSGIGGGTRLPWLEEGRPGARTEPGGGLGGGDHRPSRANPGIRPHAGPHGLQTRPSWDRTWAPWNPPRTPERGPGVPAPRMRERRLLAPRSGAGRGNSVFENVRVADGDAGFGLPGRLVGGGSSATPPGEAATGVRVRDSSPSPPASPASGPEAPAYLTLASALLVPRLDRGGRNGVCLLPRCPRRPTSSRQRRGP